MSDDLVRRLRFGVALDEQGYVSWCNQEAMFNAADRIEQLEAALRWSVRAYDDANPMRTADFHSDVYCSCIRCAMDYARKAMEGKDD